MYNYSKYNIPNCQINFKSNSRYINNIKIIEGFEKTHCYDQSSRNNLGRIAHFWGGLFLLGSAGNYIMEQSYGNAFVDILGAYLNFGLDKMFHNIAMRKSQALVRYIKSQGIQDEKQIMDIIDLYLKKRGGILYSTFVRTFRKNKIKQVANGEQASQIKGYITYIHRKYTLLSRNKSQIVKARRNLRNLKNLF